MDIFTRELTKDDFNEIQIIFHESAIYHEQIDHIFASVQGADQIWINYIDKIIQRDDIKLYIAIFDEKIVGFCMGQIIERPPVFKVRRIGLVDNIAVKKGYKQQGVGKLLFEKIKEWFISLNVSHIELSAATNNSQSLAFWSKMGGREFMKKMIIQL